MQYSYLILVKGATRGARRAESPLAKSKLEKDEKFFYLIF